MLLFIEEHVPLILLDIKTQTRRDWKPTKARPKIGAEHLAYTRPPFARPPGKPFAKLLILDRWEEVLGLISPGDIIKEGYNTYEDYVDVWNRINKKKGGWQPSKIIDVVEFKKLEAFI